MQVETAKPLGIAVHDHIIIGRKGNASMKGLLLILGVCPTREVAGGRRRLLIR